MGWQLSVSYRGVPFFVDTTEEEHARRGAHHQYPQRDRGTYEDLGKEDTVYNLTGYVTELSPGGYADARDKLIDACVQGGIGDLIHPYYGTKKVQCTNCNVSHKNTENGIARFSLSFLEADEPCAPIEVDNSAAKINEATDKAQNAALKDFINNWNLSNVPGYVHDAATELAQDLFSKFKAYAQPLSGVIEGTDKFTSSVASLLNVSEESLDTPMTFFMQQTNSLSDGLLSDGFSLGNKISGLERMLSLLSGSEKEAYKTQQQFYSVTSGWGDVPTYTGNRKIQANNQQALQSLVERISIIEAARMTPYMPLESRKEAIEIRDTLTKQIDMLAEKSPDYLYKRLEELLSFVVTDITKRSPELGRIGTYTPKVTLPILVIAYEVYPSLGKDISKATELTARNNIHHPGFVSGGKSLEVKLDA